jgi:hypothetical protein
MFVEHRLSPEVRIAPIRTCVPHPPGQHAHHLRKAAAVEGEEVSFARDSLLEEGVSCELVSGNADFDVRKKENGRPKSQVW